jgi:hypothetical protein
MIQPLVELCGGLYDGAKGLMVWYYHQLGRDE